MFIADIILGVFCLALLVMTAVVHWLNQRRENKRRAEAQALLKNPDYAGRLHVSVAI